MGQRPEALPTSSLHTAAVSCAQHTAPKEDALPTPAPTDPETIDVRPEIAALIDQLPPIALLRLWRVLLVWTTRRPGQRRGTRPVGGRTEA